MKVARRDQERITCPTPRATSTFSGCLQSVCPMQPSLHASSAADVLRQVKAELDAARQRVAFAQRSIPDLAEDLQNLAKQRMDSFIELARHDLPDLSHQSMVSSGSEVRSEIEDLLLRISINNAASDRNTPSLYRKRNHCRSNLINSLKNRSEQNRLWTAKWETTGSN